MNVVFIASVVVFGTLMVGVLIAGISGWFGRLVTREQTAAIQENERYNPAATLGLHIPFDGDAEEQLKAARKIAAINAAAKPRWGNVRIGQMGESDQATAFDGVRDDPVTAVKIASHHGWQGVQTGIVIGSSEPAASVRAPTQTAPPTKSVKDLVPGEDYPFIEITDDMEPAEIRKARIANAKARSAAVKALKESATATMAAAPATETSQPMATPSEPATAPAAPAGTHTGEPVAGVDYAIIDIDEEMDPAEKRSARIANAKAKSAAMKAFKESGDAPSQPASAAPSEPGGSEQQQSGQAQSQTIETPPEIPTDIAKPEYVEITDDMDPADKRTARIENAKMKSAYNKALKAAGIDPATIKE